MSDAETFDQLFVRLRALLQPFEERLVLKADTPSDYYLDTPVEYKPKTPLFFGGVRIQKRYVSFYLMPVYTEPSLLENITPALKKRMQGKSCFNFASLAQFESVEEELRELTNSGFVSMDEQYDFLKQKDSAQ